jgi:hypothetical protein
MKWMNFINGEENSQHNKDQKPVFSIANEEKPIALVF